MTPPPRKSLIPDSPLWLRVLRLGLLFSTIGWGISFFFTFTSWESGTGQLYAMGADTIEYQPLLDYWLKMASATFGCIGLASLAACVRPAAFAGLICLLAPFHLFVGAVLACAARTNHLSTELHPTFVPDITFCFSTGLLIAAPLVAAHLRNRRQKRGEDSTSAIR